MGKTIKRTVLRSSKGKKLYAVRKKGRFTDIQDAGRCSKQDQRKTHTASDRA